MDTYQKLDIILNVLNRRPQKISLTNLSNEIRKEYDNKPLNGQDLFFAKLIRDGYAESLKEEEYDEATYYVETFWVTYYNITIDGQIFILEGGYSQKFEEQNTLKEIQTEGRVLAKRLFWLNVILAVGTSVAAVYYLKEIFRPFPAPEFWLIVAALIGGALSSILTTYLSKRKQALKEA